LARLDFVDLGTTGSPYAHDEPLVLLVKGNARGREGVPAGIEAASVDRQSVAEIDRSDRK